MSSFLSGIFYFDVSMFSGGTAVISRVGKTTCRVARISVAVMMVCAGLGSR